MKKHIIDATKQDKLANDELKPIGDGHSSERIWVGDHYEEYYNKVFADKLGIDVSQIPDDMFVHHIDGNRLNNDIDNLMLGTKKAHERLENLCYPEKYNHEND